MQKIMFNDKYRLNKAVLEGRKTNTRRIAYIGDVKNANVRFLTDGKERGTCVLCDGSRIVARSAYKVGEEVAIAQSYKDAGIEPDEQVLVKWVRNHAGLYDDAYQKAKYLNGWHNKMFVRADLMPHRIKITNIRVERLQDISFKDCIAEGIKEYRAYQEDSDSDMVWFVAPGILESYNNPFTAFSILIDKVSGKGTWASNPYVFVYEFELVK